MRILHILSSVDPRGGGPTEGVRQRGLRLQADGHNVEIVSLDDPAAPFVADSPLRIHAMGPPRTGYRYSARLLPWLQENITRFDAVVVNGLWQYHSFAARQALAGTAVPYFVFTHGMLDPWFKRAHPLKHLKKWLYWPWADYRLLRDARAVLFTSEEERLLARESFWLYRAREEVVAYGTSTPPGDAEGLRTAFLAAHPHLQGKRLLLFLSRIHEKKGCDLLIDAFARSASSMPELHLLMAGPAPAGLLQRLQAQARDAGVGERIHWIGMAQGPTKWGAFYASEAFVLPSHQENFGIAVAEALACGLPVLISDKVNIWREVDAAGAGFVAPDTVEGTTSMLARWLALSGAERAAMALRARALFNQRYTVDAMASSLLEVVQRHSQVPLAHAA